MHFFKNLFRANKHKAQSTLNYSWTTWWRDCKISVWGVIARCIEFDNLPLGRIFQKIVVAATSFSLQLLVSSCTFSETLQTISNGQNPSLNDLKRLLNSKRHVFTNWDMSLHKRHDICDQESQLFKETQCFKDCLYIFFKSDRIDNLFWEFLWDC